GTRRRAPSPRARGSLRGTCRLDAGLPRDAPCFWGQGEGYKGRGTMCDENAIIWIEKNDTRSRPMFSSRKSCFLSPLAVVIGCVRAAGASAQNYPDRPVRVILGVPAGGTPDVLARTVIPGMSEVLGQPLVIDNRGGAGGRIGAELAAHS